MKPILRRFIAAFAFAASAFSSHAPAHESRAGDVRIVHAYATPTPPGAPNGAAYFATLENTGKQPDRLLRARTALAQSVQLHTMNVDAQGVMRMREVGEIEIAPGASLKMRPGEGYHLMLMGLGKPLKEGESFPLELEFARGGRVEVKVVVQTPRAAKAAEHTH